MAMATSNAVARIIKHMDGAKLLLESLEGSEKYAEHMHIHFEHCANILKGQSMKFREAALLVSKVQSMPFFASQKTEMFSLIEECVKTEEWTQKPVDAVQQDFTQIHRYLSQETWEYLTDEDREDMVVCLKIANDAHKVGLRVASEPTYQKILALILYGKPAVSPQAQYKMLQVIKDKVKTIINRKLKMDDFPFVTKLPVAPEHHDQKWMEHAFGAGQSPPPVPSSVSLYKLDEICRGIPMRKSRRDVDTTVLRTSASCDQAQMPMQVVYQMMNMLNQNGLGGQMGRRDVDIPFDDLRNLKKARSADLLALMDIPRDTPQDMQRLEKLDKLEKLEKLKRLEAFEQSAGSASESPASAKAVEGPATPSAFEAHAATTALEAPAAPTAPKLPGPLEAARMLAEAAGGAKGIKRKGNGEDAAKEKAKEKAAKEKAKEKAAKDKAKQKAANGKPNASTSSNGKKDFKLPSDKRRLQLYPNGCSKCRRKPGCTPSCFKYRGGK